MMSSGPDLLFDSDLMARRLARVSTGGPPDDFLTRHAEEEIAHRLGAILRRFDSTALIARTPPASLATDARLGLVRTAGPFPDADIETGFDHLPFEPASLDCIIALPGLEFANDLAGALIQIRRALKPDGLFLGAMLCGTTLTELRHCWLDAEASLYDGASPRVAPFADIRDLGGLLQRAGLALPVCDIDRLTVRYQSGLALMRELKALGLANALVARSRRPVTRGLLTAAALLYDARHADPDGRVRASFDLAWLTAWAPHESQQQPLRPGSAKARLADALRTVEQPLKR